MQDLELLEKIIDVIKESPLEYRNYYNAYIVIRDSVKSDPKTACHYSSMLREMLDYPLMNAKSNLKEYMGLRDKTLLLEAPYIFDSYIQYLEINQPLEKRLYLPRRKVLKRVVDLFQKLADDELDEIFISMPPRTGKTTIATLFLTWIIGRDSSLSNLYSSYSDGITAAFYKGVLQIIDDPYTYTWHEIFPNSQIVETNAANETINIDVKKKYASLTCRSVEGTLNGACDCDGFLVADDLVRGIEEATNPDRLKGKMEIILNDLLTRTKPHTGIAWIGTRWSLLDPMGVRLNMLENDSAFSGVRWEKLNLPALGENGESNFDYLYNKGFSTEAFLKQRASYEKVGDMESWYAQYMCEPIEREGALFRSEQLNFFNGVLPDGDPDYIFMAVDVALGGGDYLSAPVCYQYGDAVYIVDWIFDKSEKNITRQKIIDAIKKWHIQAVQFERNNGGGEYKDYLEAEIKAEGIRIKITTKAASTKASKESRIYGCADDIRANFIFLDDGKRNKDYSDAMTNLYSFQVEGKNKHDDAPDSLAQAWDMMASKLDNKPVIIRRPF